MFAATTTTADFYGMCGYVDYHDGLQASNTFGVREMRSQQQLGTGAEASLYGILILACIKNKNI
jgi:hypothetical protein